jgi:flagellar hook-length control protein FliK
MGMSMDAMNATAAPVAPKQPAEKSDQSFETKDTKDAKDAHKSADFLELMLSLTGQPDATAGLVSLTPDQMTPDQLSAFKLQTQQKSPSAAHRVHLAGTRDAKAGLTAFDRQAAEAVVLQPGTSGGHGKAALNETALKISSFSQESLQKTATDGSIGRAQGHGAEGMAFLLQQRQEVLKLLSQGDQPALNLPAQASETHAQARPPELKDTDRLVTPAAMTAQGVQAAAGAGPASGSSDAGQMSQSEHQVAEYLKFWTSKNLQNAEFKVQGWDESAVQVKVSLQGSSAHVEFTTDHQATRDFLTNGQDELKQLLAQQGLMLLDVSVGGSMSQPSTAKRFGHLAERQSSLELLGRPFGDSEDALAGLTHAGSGLRALKTGLGALDLYV